MDTTQELLLVDDHDTFNGLYANRLACHTGKGLHHRAFVVVIFNNKQEILLQKRKHQLWDGSWDVTAISHVLHLKTSDETYEQAGHRALQDEMGIPAIQLRRWGGFNYFAKEKDNFCENEYCAVLSGVWSGIVKPNYNLLYDYRWCTYDQFYKEIKHTPDKFTPWTIYTAQLLSEV